MQDVRRHHLLAAALTVVAALLVAGSVVTGSAASADAPTATIEAPTPETTLFVVQSPESNPTTYATAAPEQSTPVITSPPPATVAEPQLTPTAAPTAPIFTFPTPVATKHGHVIVPTPSTSGVYAPLPSPADLRLNARLRWGMHIPHSVRRWAYLIVPVALKYGLDPNLVAAVMTMESNGDPLAWSGADARGLMQVLHGPWDPTLNIETGVRILSTLLRTFRSLPLVLAAYNAGPGAVESYNGIPPYRETRDYVIVVSYLYDLFRHHHLTHKRREQYRTTLRDLVRFADQRKKVARLARIAHLRRDPVLLCDVRVQQCGGNQSEKVFVTHDPFWPLAGRPDPLQRVDPYAAQ
ncbi:MAG: hypothetical protein DLM70_06805 [Chloroflexi bacterium]|nr:MAG: hypothetical protein DLM70_06805 [Chloroflexota bacterium]